MASLKPDIGERIIAEFAPHQRNEARDILLLLSDEVGGDSDRILRCVLYLAKGDLTRLIHNADRARSDFRDVVYWAEYDEQGHKIRDFNHPYSAGA